MAKISYAHPLLAAGVIGLAVTCFTAASAIKPTAAAEHASEALTVVEASPPAAAPSVTPQIHAAMVEMGRLEACQAEFTRVVSENPIDFVNGGWGLDARARIAVNKLAVVGKACSGLKIEVQAFTDSQGKRASNMWLSGRRAEAVKQYLVELGLSPDLLTAVGFGPDRPVASNRTSSGRARNRRIEFRVTRVESE